MSALIQALERLEKNKQTSLEDLSVLFIHKRRKKNKSKTKITLLVGLSLFISGISAIGINLYKPQENEEQKIVPEKLIPLEPTPILQSESDLKDIPVPVSYPVYDLTITEKEIITVLEDIDYSFPQVEISSKKTEKNYQKIKNTEPDNTQLNSKFLSLVWLAESAYKQGNLEESLEYYQKAYSIKKDQDILENIILLKVSSGQLESVIRDIENLSSQKRYNVVLQIIEEGNLDTAQKLLLKFIPYDKDGDMFYLLGYLYELKENYQKALEFYRKAYFKSPQDQYFMYAYARLLEVNGDVDQAQIIFNRLKNIPDLDPDIKHAISG